MTVQLSHCIHHIFNDLNDFFLVKLGNQIDNLALLKQPFQLLVDLEYPIVLNKEVILETIASGD